jgi:hypothetical protein
MDYDNITVQDLVSYSSVDKEIIKEVLGREKDNIYGLPEIDIPEVPAESYRGGFSFLYVMDAEKGSGLSCAQVFPNSAGDPEWPWVVSDEKDGLIASIKNKILFPGKTLDVFLIQHYDNGNFEEFNFNQASLVHSNFTYLDGENVLRWGEVMEKNDGYINGFILKDSGKVLEIKKRETTSL